MAIEPHLERLEALVMKELLKATALHGGATDEAISDTTGLAGNTVRPRRGALVMKGIVEWSGEVRRLKSGRNGKLWRVKAGWVIG